MYTHKDRADEEYRMDNVRQDCHMARKRPRHCAACTAKALTLGRWSRGQDSAVPPEVGIWDAPWFWCGRCDWSVTTYKGIRLMEERPSMLLDRSLKVREVVG